MQDRSYAAAVHELMRLPSRRPMRGWAPAGEEPWALFRSLAEHRLALYPTPAFLWSGFFSRTRQRPVIAALVAELAAGGSMFRCIRQGQFHAPLTRAMCHAFLQAPPERPFLLALRQAQLRGVAPEHRDELLATAWGRDLF